MTPGMWAVLVPALVSLAGAAAAWLRASAAARTLDVHLARHTCTSAICQSGPPPHAATPYCVGPPAGQR